MKKITASIACLIALIITCAYAQPVLRDFSDSGRPLPAGVPRTVDANGNVIDIKLNFTTQAFQKASLSLLIEEANRVAEELNLNESMPITESKIVQSFVSPFGFSYAYKKIGNITTSNYFYGVEQGNKFSDLVVANYDKTCLSFKKSLIATDQIDTNAAYQQAAEWLVKLCVDVRSLSRDCLVSVRISDMWNDSFKASKASASRCVPIYDVFWLSPENQIEGGSVAYVQLFAPRHKLLQLSVGDPKYILRKPLVFTNLPALFPGKALIRTNYPVRAKSLSTPPP